jgi:nucleoside-diphosphate-sugar epimerase
MIPTDAALDDLLSEPTDALIASFRRLAGDILILGAGGKMGPSLARLAVRATRQAGVTRRVIAVSRFGTPGLQQALNEAGAETVALDLSDADAREHLPACPNVVYMVGQKFGTSGDAARTWALNAWLPGVVAERFRGARMVAFSTGNVYPLWPVDRAGPDETVPPAPVGEYAQSALARERVLQYFSERFATPMALLRLNYAVELRYGVLRDVADRVFAGEPVNLTMGYVNVIWQRDANAVALMALAHAASPPLVLNVTGRPAVAVRRLAEAFGRRFDRPPRFTGAEATTALLSDASRCEEMFGPPAMALETMIDLVASWVMAGGRSLGKPTHFQERSGAF